MRSHRVVSSLGLVFTALSLAPAAGSAQAPARNGTQLNGSVLHVTPYIGYMVFGNFLNGPLGTSVSNAPSVLYGAQAALSLAPNVSLVGNFGYTQSNIRAGIPFLGGVNIANSSTLLYDGDLQFDVPLASTSAMSLVPFVQGGVGGMHYNITQSFFNTTADNLTGNVGVGADLAIGKGMAIRLLAKDYFGRFNFQQATSFNVSNQTTQNFAFTAGLRLDF